MNDAIDVRLVIEADIATTHLIQQILKACEPYDIRTVTRHLDRLKVSDFDPETIPLFVRCGDPMAQAWTEALSDANRVYAYYLDDNFWRIVGTTSLAAYYSHPVIRRSLESNISHAQLVITNSDELGHFVKQFNPRVVVLPSFFDFSSLDKGLSPAVSPAEIRIGFAGSPSRLDDLDLVAPIVPRILAKFPKTVFEFVGAFPRGMTESDRVRRFPHRADYSDYIRWQQHRGWAIGMAPLVDHEANRSKTDNKYREYGAFGYAGIYSAIPPYVRVVKHDETGLLVANTPEAWFDAIDALLTHPDKRASIAQHAFTDVRTRYDIGQVSAYWAKQLRTLASERRSDAQPVDEAGLKRRLKKALIMRWRLHVSLRYREGGLGLVARRGARLITRRLHRLVVRGRD